MTFCTSVGIGVRSSPAEASTNFHPQEPLNPHPAGFVNGIISRSAVTTVIGTIMVGMVLTTAAFTMLPMVSNCRLFDGVHRATAVDASVTVKV